jgi:FtsZ-binding cell division protein ZapB
VFARLVLVGADGRRLHEEIIASGRIAPPTGRSRRVELEERRHDELLASIEAALEPGACRLAPQAARLDLAGRWADLEPLLANDIQVRARERKSALQRTLDARQADERRSVETVFTQLKATLDTALDEPTMLQLTFDELEAEEKQAYERDGHAWRARRDGLAEEKVRELDAIEARYGAVSELVFPFAVALCTPEDLRTPEDRRAPENGGGQ